MLPRRTAANVTVRLDCERPFPPWTSQVAVASLDWPMLLPLPKPPIRSGVMAEAKCRRRLINATEGDVTAEEMAIAIRFVEVIHDSNTVLDNIRSRGRPLGCLVSAAVKAIFYGGQQRDAILL